MRILSRLADVLADVAAGEASANVAAHVLSLELAEKARAWNAEESFAVSAMTRGYDG
jgi:hypothetical protein